MVFFGPANPDSRIGYNIDIRRFARKEVMLRIAAQINFVMAHIDVERLCEFARSRTQAMQIIQAAPLLHQVDAAFRFERANQN